MPRTRWFLSTLTALFLSACLTPLAAATPPAAAAGGTTPQVSSASWWIATQLAASDGVLQTAYGTESYSDYGLTADAVLALAATGAGKTAAAEATAQLARHVGDYTGAGTDETYSGATAKVLLLAEVEGVDPTNFGGRDLVGQLQGLQATTGTAKGRFSDHSQYGDYSNVLGQALAVIGLHRRSVDVSEAVAYLQLQQCPAGGVRLSEADTACTDDSTADPDATGLALQAFVAAGATSAADKAAAWLVAQQDADGSFKGAAVTATPNANSTGVIAAGLAAHGDSAPLGRAQAWLRSVQLGCSAETPDRGAVAYDPTARDTAATGGIPPQAWDQFRRATFQAVPGIAGVSYDTLDAATAGPLAAPADCPDTHTIIAVYQGVLGRNPDAGGLYYWQHALALGMNQLTMISAIASTSEAARQVVTLEYSLVLHRVPDPGGLEYWSGLYQKGGRADAIAALLASSPERFTNDGGQNWQWVYKSLYETILGRTPDLQGLFYWTDQANKAGPAGRSAIVPPFLNTDEAAAVVITKLYGDVCDGSTPPGALVAKLTPGLRATNLNPVLTRTAIVLGGC